MAGKGFGGLKPKTGNSDSIRFNEVVDMVEFVDKKWVELRFLDKAPLQVRQAWIKILAGKDKREVTIPRYVVNFDPSNPDVPKKGIKCPYSELSTGKDGAVRVSDFWLMNAINRDKQEEGAPRKSEKPTKEERKTGFKDIRAKSWTPVQVARLTSTMVARMQELGEDNIRKDKKTGKKAQFDATHAEHGFDVRIKYKKDAPGTDKYSIDKVDGGNKALTKEENAYLFWNLTEELLDITGRMTEAQAREDVKRMEIVGDIPDEDDDEDDEPKSKKKGKRRDLDDDEDDEPKSKKKGKRPFDEDEDDEPKSKKKKSSSKDKVKSKAASKKKSDDDDDEDEDEDEDDEPKSKKKKSSSKDKVKSKKKSDDDDDDDDEPKSKKKKSSSKDKVKSKKKADEPKSKKKADEPKSKKKASSKDKVKSKKKKSAWKDDE